MFAFITHLRPAASAAAKPGLGALLLDEVAGSGGLAVASSAAATVAAALLTTLPSSIGLATSAKADASTLHITLPSLSLPKLGAADKAAQDTGLAPRPFTSLLDPYAAALILAKNIAMQLLIHFNIYMLALNDWEYKKMAAEENGRAAPPAPEFVQIEACVRTGTWYGAREMIARVVRLTYEHALHAWLGPRRAQPFLRNGVVWVVDVLRLRHAKSSLGRRVFSYTFAILHSSALFYAAEFTVGWGLHAISVFRDPRIKRNRDRAWRLAQSAAFQALRCSLLLGATSLAVALGALAKPSIGTRLMPLAADQLVNSGLQPLARVMLG